MNEIPIPLRPQSPKPHPEAETLSLQSAETLQRLSLVLDGLGEFRVQGFNFRCLGFGGFRLELGVQA